MPTLYINIGSNIGDRRSNLERAVALIAKAWPDADVRRSQYIETAPWGYTSANTFLNLGVAVDIASEIDPERALATLLDIEKMISPAPHRNADGTYRDRAIDIDLIAIDCLRHTSPTLILPHPRAAQREFVMTPLRQLAPDAVVSFISEIKR